MIAYLDSSVMLRMVLGERGQLAQWKEIETGVTSALAEVECLRTLDRLRLRGDLDDAGLASRREMVLQLLDAVELVHLAPQILRRAADPFPTALGTLDALHLATALAWREERGERLVLATHDMQLATAARASGFDVIGAQ